MLLKTSRTPTCFEKEGELSLASRTLMVTVVEAVDTGVPLSVATTVNTYLSRVSRSSTWRKEATKGT